MIHEQVRMPVEVDDGAKTNFAFGNCSSYIDMSDSRVSCVLNAIATYRGTALDLVDIVDQHTTKVLMNDVPHLCILHGCWESTLPDN